MNNNEATLLDFLKDACQQVNSFESSAKQALIDNNNSKYIDIMLEKAKFLATISAKSAQILLLVTPSLKDIVEPELQNFSASALNAISHNSPFYMSALLFPDNYIAGDLNNLEIFTLKIENMLKNQ